MDEKPNKNSKPLTDSLTESDSGVSVSSTSTMGPPSRKVEGKTKSRRSLSLSYKSSSKEKDDAKKEEKKRLKIEKKQAEKAKGDTKKDILAGVKSVDNLSKRGSAKDSRSRKTKESPKTDSTVSSTSHSTEIDTSVTSSASSKAPVRKLSTGKISDSAVDVLTARGRTTSDASLAKKPSSKSREVRKSENFTSSTSSQPHNGKVKRMSQAISSTTSSTTTTNSRRTKSASIEDLKKDQESIVKSKVKLFEQISSSPESSPKPVSKNSDKITDKNSGGMTKKNSHSMPIVVDTKMNVEEGVKTGSSSDYIVSIGGNSKSQHMKIKSDFMGRAKASRVGSRGSMSRDDAEESVSKSDTASHENLSKPPVILKIVFPNGQNATLWWEASKTLRPVLEQLCSLRHIRFSDYVVKDNTGQAIDTHVALGDMGYYFSEVQLVPKSERRKTLVKTEKSPDVFRNKTAETMAEMRLKGVIRERENSNASEVYNQIFGVYLPQFEKDAHIPDFLDQAMKCMIKIANEDSDNFHVLTIFPKSLLEVRTLEVSKNAMECGNLTFDDITARDLAPLIITYFYELPDPLVSEEICTNMIKALDITDISWRCSILHSLVLQIPPLFREILYFMVQSISTIVDLDKSSGTNKNIVLHHVCRSLGPAMLGVKGLTSNSLLLDDDSTETSTASTSSPSKLKGPTTTETQPQQVSSPKRAIRPSSTLPANGIQRHPTIDKEHKSSQQSEEASLGKGKKDEDTKSDSKNRISRRNTISSSRSGRTNGLQRKPTVSSSSKSERKKSTNSPSSTVSALVSPRKVKETQTTTRDSSKENPGERLRSNTISTTSVSRDRKQSISESTGSTSSAAKKDGSPISKSNQSFSTVPKEEVEGSLTKSVSSPVRNNKSVQTRATISTVGNRQRDRQQQTKVAEFTIKTPRDTRVNESPQIKNATTELLMELVKNKDSIFEWDSDSMKIIEPTEYTKYTALVDSATVDKLFDKMIDKNYTGK
eukprot:TRINITY_DN7080_c0_g1_i1.p1 TRINITY_DN7080_c0_g1~~TRINITY_DN7080_c0_g1_i1.p1  ORF type:complete len:993 (-),score=272.83 TRINITY_DN7080_c0_g1_i1:2406-5384(-)